MARTRQAHARPTTEELQAAYLEDVYAFVARRLARREDAEDVTAEVFAAAFEALPKFKGQCEPRLWLLGIARRKVADALRRCRRHPELLAKHDATELDAIPAPTLAPESAALSAEEARIVREIVAKLRPAWRDALMLHYADGLTIDEVAVVMRRSPAAANSLLQRARATLYREGKSYFVDAEE